jgi:hypothetical protein
MMSSQKSDSGASIASSVLSVTSVPGNLLSRAKARRSIEHSVDRSVSLVQLLVRIVCANSLKEGTSDPFCMVWTGEQFVVLFVLCFFLASWSFGGGLALTGSAFGKCLGLIGPI